MRFSLGLVSALTVAFAKIASAASVEKVIPCATDEIIDPSVEALLRGVVSRLTGTVDGVLEGVSDVVGGLLPRQSSTRSVGVYWHTVQAGSAASQGALTSTQINNQISAMNRYTAPRGFSFYLISTDTTTNSDWYNNAIPGSTTQTTMKRTLKKGTGPNTLDVYTVAFTAYNGLLGYATFPWSYRGNPTDDGVVFNYRTVPGGSLGNYNSGGTLTHEVGHWLGLYHTFQGGCSDSAGDYVSDTAAESEAHFSCSSQTDSCPNNSGVDPLTNFMSYTPDPCKSGFTSGQGTRAVAAWTTYRGQ